MLHHTRNLYEVVLVLVPRRASSMFLPLTVGHEKVWRWGGFQWHNVSTKFCENQLVQKLKVGTHVCTRTW
jgi:hypothetical protein